MLRNFGYLLVQLLILLFPPTWATLHYQINQNVTNVYTEFLIYLGGVTGAVVGVPAALFALIVPETLTSVVLILAYISIAIIIYMQFYLPTWKRILLVTVVNGWVAVWSVIFGNIFLFLATQ